MAIWAQDTPVPLGLSLWHGMPNSTVLQERRTRLALVGPFLETTVRRQAEFTSRPLWS
jgi:hypothetical protein